MIAGHFDIAPSPGYISIFERNIPYDSCLGMDSRWRRTVLEFSLQVLAVWVDALSKSGLKLRLRSVIFGFLYTPYILRWRRVYPQAAHDMATPTDCPLVHALQAPSQIWVQSKKSQIRNPKRASITSYSPGRLKMPQPAAPPLQD